MLLQASECYYHPNDENECLTVGFRTEDDQYFLLSRCIHPTEQDRRLGLDGIHLELNDQRYSCYDGIRSVSVMPTCIRFDLSEQGAGALQTQFIEITHDLPPERSHQMRLILGEMFTGFQRYADLG
ncbi:MAG: Imm10 family immunity protein [Verrucomicrobiota bacterium]